jgi:hypothetical protein
MLDLQFLDVPADADTGVVDHQVEAAVPLCGRGNHLADPVRITYIHRRWISAATILAVFKPRGVTRYGRRKLHQQRPVLAR